MSRWNIWDEHATPDMVPGVHGEHINPSSNLFNWLAGAAMTWPS